MCTVPSPLPLEERTPYSSSWRSPQPVPISILQIRFIVEIIRSQVATEVRERARQKSVYYVTGASFRLASDVRLPEPILLNATLNPQLRFS